jgi:hypothetical protein
MPRSFSIEVKHYHVTLHRWTDQDVISVTISPSGYVLNAHSETHGFDVELTEQEQRYIIRALRIDQDE